MGEGYEYGDAGGEVSEELGGKWTWLMGDRDKEFLESIVAEVEENVKGKRVRVEGEDDVVGVVVEQGSQ